MEYFKQFCEERNLQPETIRGYKSTLKKYSEYYQMSIDELIDEAINEEIEGIDKRRRSIKTRLLQFRTFLLTETNLKQSSIKTKMRRIITIYAHFDVEIPKLPMMQKTDKNETTYFDLPTKKQIKMAIDIAGIRIASLILFMVSSGTGRTECANITIQDFFDATRDYHSTNTIPEIIEELYSCTEPIVPTFTLWRQKTKKKYYTFCTPECTNAIIEWLQLRLKIAEQNEETIQFEDTLWNLTQRQITYHFQHINDELEFGFKGEYRFLRPHTLRKFHASNIGLSQETVDLLQGRSRDYVHETYIKTNPLRLKQTYMNVMENVTLHDVGKKEIIQEEFTINLNLNFYGAEFGINI